MSSFHPRDAGGPKRNRKRRLEIEGLPLEHRIQMLEELGQQAHPDPADVTTCLVPRLVLVEPPVGVARALTDVQAERISSTWIMKQDHVDAMSRSALANG